MMVQTTNQKVVVASSLRAVRYKILILAVIGTPANFAYTANSIAVLNNKYLSGNVN